MNVKTYLPPPGIVRIPPFTRLLVEVGLLARPRGHQGAPQPLLTLALLVKMSVKKCWFQKSVGAI